MTLAEIFTLGEALARTFPLLRDALRMLRGGHPDAQRVNDILDEEDGASARAAAAMRAEDGS